MEEFEIGPIRPPSEGGSHSLLIRFTRNCPWNRCAFCSGIPYGGSKFELRPIPEIKADIDRAKGIADIIHKTSRELGLGGRITGEVADAIFHRYQESQYNQCLISVFNWLSTGGRTVFLQDANSLIMKTPDLIEGILYLKASFPTIERITSYARAKTVYKKSLKNMVEIRRAGLTRLHVGLETGDDELLKKVRKGVSAEEHVAAGKKVVEAGIELSEYIMPGLGGREMTEQHTRNTARVLNQINPHYIRSRPFAPIPGTPLAKECLEGDFAPLTCHELLKEIGQLIEGLTVESRLCFDHAMNPCYRSRFGFTYLFDQGYEGYALPDEKGRLLSIVKEGLLIEEEKFPGVEERAMMAR